MGENTNTGDVVNRAELLRFGATESQIRAQHRRGELARVGRGFYVPGGAFSDADPDSRHRLRVRGVLGSQATSAVVSHISAALEYGLPLWNVPLDRVHLTKEPGRVARRRGTDVWVHTARLESDEIVFRDGVVLTAPARTVIDTALTVPYEVGVAVADAALHAGLVTEPELWRALESAVGRHGRAKATAVVEFADGRSESAGESWSRVCFARAGLPRPELQQWILRPNGSRIGRVDFWWKEFRLIGEFDGMIKYQKLLRPGQSASEVVVAERGRERELEGQHNRVARWIWADLRQPDPLIAEIRRLLAAPRR